MRFYEKVLILILAICLSVLGFELIASSSVCFLKAARAASYEPIQNYSERCGANGFYYEFIALKPSPLNLPSNDSQSTYLDEVLLVERGHNSTRITKDQ